MHREKSKKRSIRYCLYGVFLATFYFIYLPSDQILLNFKLHCNGAGAAGGEANKCQKHHQHHLLLLLLKQTPFSEILTKAHLLLRLGWGVKDKGKSSCWTFGRKEEALPGREGPGRPQVSPLYSGTLTLPSDPAPWKEHEVHTGATLLLSLPTRLTEALDMAVGRGDPASSFLQKGSDHHHPAVCWQGDSSFPHSNSDRQPVKPGMAKIRPEYEWSWTMVPMTQVYYMSWGRRKEGQENIWLLIRLSVNRSLDGAEESRSIRRRENVSLWGSKPDSLGEDEALDL